MLVKAKKLGFYGGKRRRAGETFEIVSKKQLGKWMELVSVRKKPGPKPKPEKVAVLEPELVEAEKEE